MEGEYLGGMHMGSWLAPICMEKEQLICTAAVKSCMTVGTMMYQFGLHSRQGWREPA